VIGEVTGPPGLAVVRYGTRFVRDWGGYGASWSGRRRFGLTLTPSSSFTLTLLIRANNASLGTITMATRRREDTLGGTATATTSGVTRPDIGAATTSGGGTRTRGLLAFLEDKVTVFAFHADGCQTQLATPVRHYVRGGRRRRRQHQPQEQSRTPCCDDDNQASRRRRQSVGQPLVKEEPSSLPSSSCIAATGITTSLTELLAMHQPKIVVLFFYDPEQAYSVLVRNRLLPVLHAFLDDKQTQADKKREDIDDDKNNEHIHERISVVLCRHANFAQWHHFTRCSRLFVCHGLGRDGHSIRTGMVAYFSTTRPCHAACPASSRANRAGNRRAARRFGVGME
jgi:hypothetical protein